jgi:divalent metal cation (Fe/Co/Zn/Cd) transporter
VNATRRPFAREQRLTIIHGMLIFVLVIVVLQLWLLNATMNAWLGGDDSIVWPAAGASAACLALNVGLFRYLVRIERTRKSGA